MMFCKKCQTIMQVDNDGGKAILRCGNCGATTSGDISIKEKPNVREVREAVDDKNMLAVHEHICSKCGYNKAEIIDLGVWYADEDHAMLFRCGKCGHTDRASVKEK